jgi:hypothetical protein
MADRRKRGSGEQGAPSPVGGTTPSASARKGQRAGARQPRAVPPNPAYRLAEARGFDGAGMLDDWLAAEQQVDAALPGDAATGSRKQAGQGMGQGEPAGPRRGGGDRR